MPRSGITGKDIDLITDDGAILASIAKGEQVHMHILAENEVSFNGYTITAKVVEGDNVEGAGQTPPTQEAASPTVTTLEIIDQSVSDNQFIIVLPHDLCDAWAVQPMPDDPVYGFFALQVEDTGVGAAQQRRVPVRGLIEITYNPVETV